MHHNTHLFATLVHDRHNALIAAADRHRLFRQHRSRARRASSSVVVAVDAEQRR